MAIGRSRKNSSAALPIDINNLMKKKIKDI